MQTAIPLVIWRANACERANSNDVLNTRDCKDTDNTVYPGADKLCDGQVNDVDADEHVESHSVPAILMKSIMTVTDM